MQRVVVHAVGGDVVPDIAPGPLDQGVDFAESHAVLHVVLHRLHFGAGVGLFAAKARDPGTLTGQSAAQGLQFADLAAGLALGLAVVNGGLTRVANKVQHRQTLRLQHLHGGVGKRLQALEQGQGFGVQRPGVEHKHRNRQLQTVDHIGDDHVLGTHTGGLLQRAEVAGCTLQQGLGLRQFVRKVRAGLGMQARGGGFGRLLKRVECRGRAHGCAVLGGGECTAGDWPDPKWGWPWTASPW